MTDIPLSRQQDRRWMRAALMLACRGEGRVAPNPAVGCVIIRDGVLVGQGRTADGGRPHAETIALAEAGGKARGATAYVTLEPCAHHGQTPPCADALIAAGVARVVVAAGDPDPRVAGEGLRRLTEAGIRVDEGVLTREAAAGLAGYFSCRRQGRPLVTVKIATTLDGRIALADGTSQWITGPLARRWVHEMRSRHDAVLTASGTLNADDPELTCRLDGVGHQPVRVVVASHDLPGEDTALFQTLDKGPVWCFGPEDTLASLPQGFKGLAVATDADGRPDLKAVMARLADEGITAVMVEAGGRFAASLIKAGLVDRLVWMRSSSVIGGDGLASLAELGLETLADGALFERKTLSSLGDDAIEVLHRKTGA
ncbi:MAG: bifunctional diaminohydroxyphosphoribosylaminopyrimidine deaminase/5-amino-6-(5-phosphoribosylamino)uracil reductase RibD [Candidatus Puniceispirillales bacterium]